MIRIALRLSLVSVVMTAAMLMPACARSGPVTFEVFTSETGAPINAARIDVSYPMRSIFAPHDFSVITDDRGFAERVVERAPRIDVQIDHPGYRPLTQSLLVDNAATWTLHRDPTLIISKHTRPATFEITRDESSNDVAIKIHLQWEARPTHLITLPENFRGLILLTRDHKSPPLPDAPTPRVFTAHTKPNGTAAIPAWPIEQAPFERFRFLRSGASELPAFPQTSGGLYVALLRESQESALFIVGDDQDETAMRNALWIFAPTGSSRLNIQNFTRLVDMINASDTPVTRRHFTSPI